MQGRVINVSAGEDVDKEGGAYRDYFSAADDYTITNYHPGSSRGYQGRDGEILLDLIGEIPEELRRAFDVVFNHTTLEHMFEVGKACANLCELSRDLVIVVVPFAQVQHAIGKVYGDYWRFTPECMHELFGTSNLEIVYESESPDADAGIYLFVVASRHPERWRSIVPPHRPIERAGAWIGAADGTTRDE